MQRYRGSEFFGLKPERLGTIARGNIPGVKKASVFLRPVRARALHVNLLPLQGVMLIISYSRGGYPRLENKGLSALRDEQDFHFTELSFYGTKRTTQRNKNPAPPLHEWGCVSKYA